MTNKSLTAYNTGGELVFFILPHREMIRVLFLKDFKELVNGVLEGLIIFMHFHRVYERYQRCEIPFMFWQHIANIPDDRCI